MNVLTMIDKLTKSLRGDSALLEWLNGIIIEDGIYRSFDLVDAVANRWIGRIELAVKLPNGDNRFIAVINHNNVELLDTFGPYVTLVVCPLDINISYIKSGDNNGSRVSNRYRMDEDGNYIESLYGISTPYKELSAADVTLSTMPERIASMVSGYLNGESLYEWVKGVSDSYPLEIDVRQERGKGDRVIRLELDGCGDKEPPVTIIHDDAYLSAKSGSLSRVVLTESFTHISYVNPLVFTTGDEWLYVNVNNHAILVNKDTE